MTDNSVIDFLLQRRSVLAAQMVEPAPGEAEINTILSAGLRVPDHGKITPWRIQIVRKEGQQRLGNLYAAIVERDDPDARDIQIEAARERLQRSPLLLVVSCRPDATKFAKVPKIEQQLSSGAVCMNLLNAAGALGFAAQWLTGGPAYNPEIKQELGLTADTDIIGFIHLGSVASTPKERPRPNLDDIVSIWPPRGHADS